jgi:hypothetical protein
MIEAGVYSASSALTINKLTNQQKMKKIFFLTAMIACVFALQAQNTIPNSNFEQWTDGEPVNWTVSIYGNVIGTSVLIPVEVHFGTQTADAHDGSSAIRIASADVTSESVDYTYNLPGVLQLGESDVFQMPMEEAMTVLNTMQDTNGIGSILSNLDSLDLTSLSSFFQVFSKGIPFSTTPKTISAWVKYIPQAGDSLALFAMTKKNGVPVDYAYQLFDPNDTSDYHQVSISMNTPDAVCDTLMFIVVSSTMMSSSSVLYIDDIELSFAIGINDHDKFPGSVYPNPASDRLYFHPNSDQPYTWTLTDLTGKTLLSGEAIGETSINTKDCATGVYLLQISGDGISGTRKVMIR